LDELIAIEDQSEIVLKNARPELLESIRTLVAADGTAEWLRSGKPSTTLERLFLREISEDRKP
jgi:ABC-2 type transport system ATP-binding protein